MKSTLVLSIALALTSATGCELLSPDSLDRDPHDILNDDEVWGNPDMIVGLLANFYDRLPEWYSVNDNYEGFAQLDEAMWSGYNNEPNTLRDYPYDWWSRWDYDLIRDINLFIEKVDESESLAPDDKRAFLAEARFVRAYVYFQHVTSMGGVPLITGTHTFELGDDPAELRSPRAAEAEIYDFVATEIDAVVDDLPKTTPQTHANRWMALALKSRAMLYAGSIARYNSRLANPIRTANGEVGIPAEWAEGYYRQALDAAREIIDSGNYRLYREDADLSSSVYLATASKHNNPEVIWARDFTLNGKYHQFTASSIPRSMRESTEASSEITPSLNLVEAFDYLDGSSGELRTHTADGDYVYYENPADIFADKDARLAGTIIYPGAAFRGEDVSIQAGVIVWSEDAQRYEKRTSNQLGSRHTDGGLLVGADGPLPNEFHVTNTGFYLRKYIDTRPGSGQLSQGSDTWWVRFRYAEVLLNAAEAAFELGMTSDALGYVNQVRERAGFGPNSLTSLSIEDIRNERRVELAFEDHRLWDLKRWRIAHEVWDGSAGSPDAMVYALYPYRVVRPGHENHGKYVFEKRVAPRFTEPRFFRMGNYYSQIPQDALNGNPELVPNPFH